MPTPTPGVGFFPNFQPRFLEISFVQHPIRPITTRDAVRSDRIYQNLADVFRANVEYRRQMELWYRHYSLLVKPWRDLDPGKLLWTPPRPEPWFHGQGGDFRRPNPNPYPGFNLNGDIFASHVWEQEMHAQFSASYSGLGVPPSFLPNRIRRLELHSDESQPRKADLTPTSDALTLPSDATGSRFRRLRIRKEGEDALIEEEIEASGIRRTVWDAAFKRWEDAGKKRQAK